MRGEKGATGQKGDKGDRGHLGLPVSTEGFMSLHKFLFLFFFCYWFQMFQTEDIICLLYYCLRNHCFCKKKKYCVFVKTHDHASYTAFMVS